jgi:deoxyhypusine synthase
MSEKVRGKDQYHDGFSDGFVPVEPLDLSKIESFDALLRAYQRASFGARRVGDAAAVLETMVRDPDCYTVLTVSGAMTVAKMGLVICEMIERGYVQCVISTGALMAHGMIEGTGHKHFRYEARMDDKELYEKGYNRVYDTLEPEANFTDLDREVSEVLIQFEDGKPLSSAELCRALGEHIKKKTPHARAILKSAFEHDVPVIIPSFSDSEMGLDVAVHNKWREMNGRKRLVCDCFLDLDFYTDIIKQQKNLGIFTIGGGVPRNWAQQVGPYLEITAHRLFGGEGITQKFRYGVRICPDSEHWGGLSGCTYREGTSWGKFLPEEDGGRYAEVLEDATVVWPLIVRAVMERAPKKVRR